MDVSFDVAALDALGPDLAPADATQDLDLGDLTRYALLATASVDDPASPGRVGVRFLDGSGSVLFETSIGFRNTDDLELMKVFTVPELPAGAASSLFVEGLDADDVQLYAVAVVPEPASSAAALGAGLLLLRRRR